MMRVTLAAGVALVSLTLATPARAQGVGGGLSLGLNLSEINVSGNESLNVAFTDKLEPVLGGFVSFGLSRQGSIDVNALLSIKGSLLAVDGGGQARIRLTYVDVPVLFRFAGPADSAVQMNLFAGPYGGYLLRASESRDEGEDVDVADAFESFDFGWVAGLGLSVGSVAFDARYSGGVTDIARRSNLGDLVTVGDPQPTAYRNRGFTFIGSYRF